MTTERARRGIELRRKVLGDEYVDRATAQSDGFSAPYQELVNEYVWGYLWDRSGLSHRERMLINLAIMTANNMSNEVRLYVKTALRNGVSRDDIREVFLQTTIYCGVPRARESFEIAREVFAELDAR
jgi:4-carboxymuconolactone decarboxylase